MARLFLCCVVIERTKNAKEKNIKRKEKRKGVVLGRHYKATCLPRWKTLIVLIVQAIAKSRLITLNLLLFIELNSHLNKMYLTVQVARCKDEVPDEHVHRGHHAGGVGRDQVGQEAAEGPHDLVGAPPVEPEHGVDQLLVLLGSANNTNNTKNHNTQYQTAEQQSCHQSEPGEERSLDRLR